MCTLDYLLFTKSSLRFSKLLQLAMYFKVKPHDLVNRAVDLVDCADDLVRAPGLVNLL